MYGRRVTESVRKVLSKEDPRDEFSVPKFPKAHKAPRAPPAPSKRKAHASANDPEH